MHVKKAENSEHIVYKIINLSNNDIEEKLSVPGQKIREAYICTTLEENISPLDIVDNHAVFNLKPGQITTLTLGF